MKKPEETDAAPKKKGALRENIEAIVVAVILALFIRTFVVQAFKIPSGSMKDTLLIGDHILVNKFIYGVKAPFIKKSIIPIKDPQHDDIIVFEFPEDPSKDFIKRVIGIPGDVIEIRNKKLFVNGSRVQNSHGVYKDPKIYAARAQPRDNLGPVTVPQGKLFVMGDNRDFSYDSRFWGFVDLVAVKGKAFIIYWSWDKENFGVRWSRLGHLLE
ncbi:signal peptidase I [Desulfosarcina alkanivorans]|uniref:Signal peptidase I n=1 Tax=Desulfosarcina alkanivorans TaxID=571177 RepID=A0A5K7YDT1_9BACT|nr:signal peptidase I [Desulfosarcina alkanivorans]BBO67228.1 signal peptidase I [Desulfosarcina alkanivorans]